MGQCQMVAGRSECCPPRGQSELEDLALTVKGGDVGLEHLGYSLVSRWVLAVAMGEDELVKHFDDSLAYFKRTATTL